MKQLLLIAFILGSCEWAMGQSLDAYKKSAEEAYQAKDYATAHNHSTEVLTEEPENITFLKIAAESALELCHFDQSEGYLEKIRSLNDGGSYPMMKFYLAKSQHRQGHYEEARYYYEDFINTASSEVDASYVALARKKLEECSETNMVNAQDKVGTVVKSVPSMNTSFSDFALPIFGNSRFKASFIQGEACDCDKPCRDKMEITQYSETYGAERFRPVVLPVGTKNVGHLTFTKGGNRMYFTQCDCDDDQYNCAIYFSDLNASGVWSTPIPLPESINRRGYSVTQPYAYSANSYGVETDVLYYASNYHADYGNRKDLDIYKVLIVGQNVGNPENVSAVNTDGDEVTPFYDQINESLYFSSNGRQSLGGYDFDIFKYNYGASSEGCDANGNSPQNPANIGAPINSFYDDLYFSLDDTGLKGIFTSNRKGEDRSYQVVGEAKDSYESVGGETCEFCCPDIYEATIRYSSTILVSVYCQKNGYGGLVEEPLTGSILTLRMMNDSTRSLVPSNVEEDYRYTFSDIDLGQVFSVGAEKEDFWGAYKIDTSSFCNGGTKEVKLYLAPKIKLEVYFRAKCNPDLEIEVNGVTLQGENSYAPEQMTPLYGNSTYTSILKCQQAYRIIPDSVSKSYAPNQYQFSSDRPEHAVSNDNCCEPTTIRDTFFLEMQPRSEDLKEPVPLYFYHAMPTPIYSQTEAALDYETYFEAYSDSLYEFKNATGRCNTPNQYGYGANVGYNQCNCNDDPEAVDAFFEEMQVNMNRMRSFAGILLTHIEAGDRVVIKIRGVASIAGSGGKYNNTALSARRIDSMRKYLDKYFKQNGDGKTDYMSMVEIEPEAAGVIADQTKGLPYPKVGKCRIYNVDASLDRRIEIVSIDYYSPDLQEGPCAVTNNGYGYQPANQGY